MSACNENCLVVLVEDDDAIRAAFSEILEAEGYDVMAFANGREALDSLDRPPSLILLDWMMPVMNGEEFLEARTRSGCPAGDSPVVIVSAVTEWARKVPGVSALVRKPVTIDGLLTVVRSHCRQPNPATPIGAAPVAC